MFGNFPGFSGLARGNSKGPCKRKAGVQRKDEAVTPGGWKRDQF